MQALWTTMVHDRTRLSASAPILRARPQAGTVDPAKASAPRRQPAAEGSGTLPSAAATIIVLRNRRIYFAGDPAEDCYRIVSGTVRICKETVDGRRQIAAFPTVGDLFGWAGNAHHVYSAEAVTDVTLLRWHRRTIEASFFTEAEAAQRILAMLFEQLDDAQDHMLLLGRMRACERVATFLLTRSERGPRDGVDSARVPLPMCRKDIADYLGLTVETVSRTMHALKQRGVIGFAAGDAVHIADRHELERLANGLGD